MSAAVIVQHLGHQSPLELVLTLVVGIAPFLVLGVVVAVARSRDLEDEEPRTAR